MAKLIKHILNIIEHICGKWFYGGLRYPAYVLVMAGFTVNQFHPRGGRGSIGGWDNAMV